MCGISGILSKNPSSELRSELEAMSEIQKHRGRDFLGYAFFNDHRSIIPLEYNFLPTIGLAHQRLSIQDLSSAGNQPMYDDSKKYCITYNGEIYNVKSIKAELEQLGVHFHSHSDTEVVLQAYIKWGKNCLPRFEGMFAFAIWNSDKKELVIARDRFGVKPFYFLHTKEKFAFSSEIKGFKPLPYFSKTLNPKAVYAYLVHAEVERDGLCFFSEIQELLPGTCAVFDFSTFEIKHETWYSLNESLENNLTELANQQNIKQLVQQSISDRLLSDVPVGACLSGGLDSSIIVATLIEKGLEPKSFTAIFKDFERDESKYAQEFSKHIKWFTTSPTVSDFQQDIEKVIWTQDIPFFSASTYIQYKVMELVHEAGIKVTLDGQGADEIFGGYARHYSAFFQSSVQQFHFLQSFSLWKESNNEFCSSKQLLKDFLKRYVSIPQTAEKVLNQEFVAEHRFSKIVIPSPNLNSYLHKEVTGTTLKNLLRTGDRNSMAHTVEARMPFVDCHPLTEFTLTIPAKYKIKNGVGKSGLRAAFADLVPKIILDRKDKIGFEAPQKQWFYQLKTFIQNNLPTQNDEFVQWNLIQTNFDSYFEEQLSNGKQEIWRLFNFAIWKKLWGI